MINSAIGDTGRTIRLVIILAVAGYLVAHGIGTAATSFRGPVPVARQASSLTSDIPDQVGRAARRLTGLSARGSGLAGTNHLRVSTDPASADKEARRGYGQ